MVDLAVLEDSRCPICQGFGVVEVPVEPASGLPSEGREAETVWRACECVRAGLAQSPRP